MALTKEDLTAIKVLLRDEIAPITDRQDEQAATLTQVVARQDEQAEILTQVVVRQDEQDEILTQVVARQDKQAEILTQVVEQLHVHTSSIIQLERRVQDEFKLLNENLPDVIVRNDKVTELESKIENHDVRLFALEEHARQSKRSGLK